MKRKQRFGRSLAFFSYFNFFSWKVWFDFINFFNLNSYKKQPKKFNCFSTLRTPSLCRLILVEPEVEKKSLEFDALMEDLKNSKSDILKQILNRIHDSKFLIHSNDSNLPPIDIDSQINNHANSLRRYVWASMSKGYGMLTDIYAWPVLKFGTVITDRYSNIRTGTILNILIFTNRHTCRYIFA